jgi:acetyl-CoA synthetase
VSVSQNRDKTTGAQADNYDALQRNFRWLVPEHFNIAEVCSARWARQPDAAKRIAIYAHAPGEDPQAHTFAQLQAQANRLSNTLASLGVRRGDRVAIVMPQRLETAVAYMAVLQMGAVAMPLSMLFGPQALEYRLQDSEAVVAVCDDSAIANLLEVRAGCPQLRTVLGVGAAAAQADLGYAAALAAQPGLFEASATLADDPAVLIYTSGTTGQPKGALIPHRALIGNLTGFVCSQNWFGFDPGVGLKPSSPTGGRARAGVNHSTGESPVSWQPETQSVFWSPADWAWTGGLMDALLPTLYFGRPIVAFNGRFSPEAAFTLMQQHGVTHTFLFPTALKAMMKAYPGANGKTVRAAFGLKLQAIMSAGEAVGDTVFAYCREQLGVTVNEMFGQTEINSLLSKTDYDVESSEGVVYW